jgi:hypothetical protein
MNPAVREATQPVTVSCEREIRPRLSQVPVQPIGQMSSQRR